MSDTHAAQQSGAETGEAALLGHDADGIREYDNPMPFWWSAIFWGTFFFSLLYAMYYMIGVGPGHSQEFDGELSSFYQVQAERLGDLQPNDQTLSSLMADQRMMQAAAGVFASNCATCHAKDGGGGTGPNLCDDSYLNVKSAGEIFGVISSGVVAKGMPAWDKRFGQAQRVLLAAYVAHLRGTSPSAPKEPQGSALAAWALPAPQPLAKPAAK